MDPNRFDRLTKSLAAGSSRRRVLQALLGGAAGAIGMSRAAGATPLTGACHAYCQPQPVRNRRPCYDACLACDGDTSQVCQADDGSFSCCQEGTMCQSGTCAPNAPVCTAGPNCGSAAFCQTDVYCSMFDRPACFCADDTEGNPHCGDWCFACGGGQPTCMTSDDCSGDARCTETCCGNYCIPPCGTLAGQSQLQAQVAGADPNTGN